MNRAIRFIPLIAAFLLIIGCFHLPVGYYTFLRIVVCIVAVILLFFPKGKGITYRHIVNGLVAILFNPIIPVYLHSKTAWVVIDAVVAGWFVVQAIVVNQKNI
mgnify:CR=1 FL=1